ALDEFDKRCRAKGIQVYLSPLRYRVDVQRTADIDKAKSQMLQTIVDKKAPPQSPPQIEAQTIAAQPIPLAS
ncbi:MAG: hypothetical protein WBD47_09310, partial [Phormidesmis sp.]